VAAARAERARASEAAARADRLHRELAAAAELERELRSECDGLRRAAEDTRRALRERASRIVASGAFAGEASGRGLGSSGWAGRPAAQDRGRAAPFEGPEGAGHDGWDRGDATVFSVGAEGGVEVRHEAGRYPVSDDVVRALGRQLGEVRAAPVRMEDLEQSGP